MWSQSGSCTLDCEWVGGGVRSGIRSSIHRAAKRAPGGKSDKKPEGWQPSAGIQERVRYMNGLDVDLYAWAAARELALLKQTAAAASEGLPILGETWAGVEDF